MANDWRYWNPIESYRIYKEEEGALKRKTTYQTVENGSFIGSEYNTTETAVKRSTFLAKLKGTFFIFSGYLGKPESQAKNSHYEIVDVENFSVKTSTIMDTIARMARSENLVNSFGVYDYLTLGIPYFLENLFRGNSLTKNGQQNMQWVFSTIIPIVPALAIIRNGLGFVATVVASPVVLALHGIEWIDEKVQAWKLEKANELAAQQQVIDEAIRNASTNVASFNQQYKELTRQLKSVLNPANDWANASQEEKQNVITETTKLRNGIAEAGQKLVILPQENKQTTDGYFEPSKKDQNKTKSVDTRLAKIAKDGKYSPEAVERAFAPRRI